MSDDLYDPPEAGLCEICGNYDNLHGTRECDTCREECDAEDE